MEIRRYTERDWPGTWTIWREVITAGESYDNAPDSTEDQAREHWLLPAPWEQWVAVDGDEVLGMYKVGPNRGRLGAHVANASFMVSSRASGRGLGRTLGEHCLDRARELGFAAMQFNAVVSTNTVAVRLWRSLGFTIVGTVPDAFQSTKHGLVDLHIMHRYL
ncbi:GNAT family N-acetyltransferase [Dactylosporangium sp. NPDC051485]|uniref:GNAT family N-acetyltransferase n=1 Tax=Dactylosporangium sp. NPDC051485 TaxID=3154846 RepID=UPI00343540B7